MAVIGLDFGNFNSFTCFIQDFNANTRIGGRVFDLLPRGAEHGLPSVYFYSGKRGERIGLNAVAAQAVPEANRLRYLKRRLREQVHLDDRDISIDEAITKVIEYCVRRANAELQQNFMLTTPEIALSYPATFTPSERHYLISLAEQASLEDGRRVHVAGTIMEPAAAALDYLSDFAHDDNETTVLTYDFGGGTFDLSLVAAYPKGRVNSAGRTYYYDIIDVGGLEKVGGHEIDKAFYELLVRKMSLQLSNANDRTKLMNLAETTKVALTETEKEDVVFDNHGEYAETEVTRAELESVARPLVERTVEETGKLLRAHPNQKPDMILLTGGMSRMPLVQNMMARAFPEYAKNQRLAWFRPDKAIAYGAARFGTVESAGRDDVNLHTHRDIGIRFREKSTGRPFIDVFIPAGTALPHQGEWRDSTTHKAQSSSYFPVYVANGLHPDKYNIEGDFSELMDITLRYGRTVPQGHHSDSRLSIDRQGRITVEARDPSQPDKPPIQNEVTLHLGSAG